jgi:hypothetical protein
VPGNDTVASTALQQYLTRLDTALAGLSDKERREILLETRSHVAEQARRSPMLSVPEILEELGPPEAYAQTFLVDRKPTPAALHRPGVLHGLARLATGSWIALPLLLFVLSCYSVAVLMLFIAVNELQEPETTALVVRHDSAGRTVAFAVSDPTIAGKGDDVLGWWLIPISLALAAIIHLAMRALLARVLRREPTARDAARMQPPPRT